MSGRGFPSLGAALNPLNALGRNRVLARASRVELSMYALLADRRRLQEFCDRYFNASIPAEVAYFRPAFPIVFCTVLYYRDMGDDLRWRTGTLTQSEMYFGFVIDRYRRVGNALEFVEHGVTTPYIFVDNAASAVAGRERFGFPKQVCRFGTEWEGRPAAAPSDAQHVLTVSAWEPSRAGHRLSPLLHIVRDPLTFGLGPDAGGAIPRPRAGPLSIETLLWAARTLAGELVARSDPGPGAELAGQLRELRESWRDLAFCINAYNLRQFADPFLDGKASYQDLIRFRMAVTPLGGGIIEDAPAIPAAFRLLIHRTAVRPIVDRLGLQVAARESEDTPDGRAMVDTVQAVLALRAQGDADLVRTDRLCWRFKSSGWFRDDEQPLTPQRNHLWGKYNDYIGPSTAAFLEPQPDEPVLDVKYMMLPARADVVRAHLKRIQPPGCPVSFDPITVGDYTAVRLVASRSRPPTAREQEELVWMDGQYLSISVPVQFGRGGDFRRALMMLHDFTDNSFLVQSLRELASSPTDSASFGTHSGDWFSSTADVASLLRVDALAVDRSANEALITPSRLLDVFVVDRARDERQRAAHAPIVAELWELVSGIRPILSLGSIPVPGDPSQAILRRLMLTEIKDSEIVARRDHDPAQSYYVQFHESETYPLVKRLGLETLSPDAPLSTRFREGVAGRTRVVPALAVAQVGIRIRITWMDIVWEEVGRFERGTHGGVIASGENMA